MVIVTLLERTRINLKRLIKISLFVCLLVGIAGRVAAQNYPVQVNAQLLPPYTSYLSDYAEVGAQRFMANFVLKDLTLPEYRCKLRLTIEGVGITIRTKQNFIPRQPLVLPGGGIPLQVYGEDIAEYFNPDNLDFTGITKRQYAKNAKLPEGVYRFTIEVLDYNRGTLVSNKGTSTAWIILNDPPILNLPRSETKLRILDPTYVPFTWTPRHTGSPNAAFTTEYFFRLVEIWPANRNPYDAFLSQPALYEVTTSSTQIVYGMAEPALIPGRKYAWQVQAKDSEGRDLFKNQGKSEVFVFQFGDALGKPDNIKQDGRNATTVNLSWDSPSQGEMPALYRVRYRKRGSGDQGIWYEAITTQRWITLPDLQSKTDYEVQVRSESKPQVSDYSLLKIMATSEAENLPYSCGNISIPPMLENKSRLLMLSPGDVISSRGFKFVVTEVKGSGGVFDGKGVVQVPFFNMANVRVAFAGVQLNNSRELVAGEIVTLYNPGGEIAQVVEDAHKIGEEKPIEATAPADTTVTPTPDILVGGTIDSIYVNDDGKIVVVDTEGKESAYEQKKDDRTGKIRETAIVDAAGNSYSVGEDGKVSKTSRTAGNSAHDAVPQNDFERLVKDVLSELKDESKKHVDSVHLLRKEFLKKLEDAIVSAGYSSERYLVTGDRDQYIAEGFSKELSEPLQKSKGSRTADQEIFAIEDSYVDLYTSDTLFVQKQIINQKIEEYERSSFATLVKELQQIIAEKTNEEREPLETDQEKMKLFLIVEIKQKLRMSL